MSEFSDEFEVDEFAADFEQTDVTLDRPTYERDLDLKVPIDELEEEDLAILRYTSGQVDPFGWEVFSEILTIEEIPDEDAYFIEVIMYVLDIPRERTIKLRSDGMLLDKKGRERGYFLDVGEQFELEWEDELTRLKNVARLSHTIP